MTPRLTVSAARQCPIRQGCPDPATVPVYAGHGQVVAWLCPGCADMYHRASAALLGSPAAVPTGSVQ